MRRRRKPKGQISLFLAMMIISFLVFFQFVVNTGLLVNAKINLQNAADLAAYAGAATQARLLNHVSFLNYEMRRHYKKFLYRYYVLGNLSQKNFANDPLPNSGRYRFSPDGIVDYGAPAVCITFNPTDNYCQEDVTPTIGTIPVNPLDPISVSVNQTFQALEEIRQAQCGEVSIMNRVLLELWLYNSDPELAFLERLENSSSLPSNPQQRTALLEGIRSTRALAAGLGLYPKEFLLLQRIETLESYLNFPAQAGVDLGAFNALQNEQGAIARERTILAFKSAYDTLGEYTFADESIRLTELLPGNADSAELARFAPFRTDFETYSVLFRVDSSGNCILQPELVPVREVPLGVEKDPNFLTYYAVRLEADARPMFSPFGRVRLKAYSAAQPFGSRIGPSLARLGGNEAFVASGVTANVAGVNTFDNVGIPNLPITADDNTNRGWRMNDLLREMRRMLFVTGTPGGGNAPINQLNSENYQRGYQAAMAPNPYERGLYNIINSAGEDDGDPNNEDSGDPFNKYFNTQQVHSIWAPITRLDSNQAPEDRIEEALQAAPGIDDALKGALVDSLKKYVSDIRGTPGPDGELFTVIPLRNPLRGLEFDGYAPIPLSGTYMTRSPLDLRSSWSGLPTRSLAERGRLGYSVKFVSFSTLMRGSTTSDGATPWSNTPRLDAEGLQDIGERGELINH